VVCDVSVFLSILRKPSILLLIFGGWRLLVGWRKRMLICLCNSIFLICIDGLHRTYLIYLIHMLLFDASFLYVTFDICMCLRGASLEVSSQIICDNSMYFVTIKKGEIVGPKSICPSFDGNKIYVVMFHIILFK